MDRVDRKSIVGVEPIVDRLGQQRLVKEDGHGDSDDMGCESHHLGVIICLLEEAPIALGTQPLLSRSQLVAQAREVIKFGIAVLALVSSGRSGRGGHVRTSESSVAQLEIAEMAMHYSTRSAHLGNCMWWESSGESDGRIALNETSRDC